MRGERRLLRIGEYLIARACRHLPAEARDERYREWVAELPAILQDPGVRPAARRAARMLRYASGTIRGTALTPGSAPRVMAHTARAASPWIHRRPGNFPLGLGEDSPGVDLRGDRMPPRLPPRLADHIRLQARLPQVG
jgi:hypothetical protein